MESMFLWIVLFSGAAVLLLSVFLVASERELKKKRGEVNLLLDRLEATPTASAMPPPPTSTATGAEVSSLRTKTQEQQREIAILQDDLDAAHSAIDELRSGNPLQENDPTVAQIEQLRHANAQLEAQVEELGSKLQASEAKLASTSTTNSGADELQAQLENSLIDLKQQLERSQARVRELESAPVSMPDTSASDAQHREENEKLQARIAQLETSLNTSAERACQLDLLQQRLHKSGELEQELREALRQREEEIPRWQEQLAASDEIKKRILALQPVYDQLVTKQSSLIEDQHAYHGELTAFAEFLSASHDGTITPTTYTFFDPKSAREAIVPTQLLLAPLALANGSEATTPPADTVTPAQLNSDAEMAPTAKRGFGVFHALIAVVVGGALAAFFWTQSGEQPVTHAAKPVPLTAPANKPASRPVPRQETPPAEFASSTAPIKQETGTPAMQNGPAKQAKAQSTKLAVAGTYEVTEATRVFAAPAEYAQQVGAIEPGLKVNVVNARDGWLEIHSKHGRPPGFIRSDAAARVGR